MLDPILLKYGLIVPAKLLLLGTLLVLLVRGRASARWCWAVAGLGWLACVAVTSLRPPHPTDISQWWQAGCALRQGLSPYDHSMCLMPPTVLPLLWVLAATSLEVAIAAWAWLSVVMAMVLPFLAQAGLRRAGQDTGWHLTTPVLAVLSAAVCLSPAQTFGVEIGSLAPWVTLTTVLALFFWNRFPLLAGSSLALASIKITTLFPFLMLCHWRKDRLIWIGLVLTGIALCFLVAPVAELPTYLQRAWNNIALCDQPGRINDHVHPFNFDLIRLERAFYFCGIEDRTLLRAASLAVQASLAAWLLWSLWGRRPLPWATAVSLVACFATLVLYHRVYDMPILVLPLVYAAGQGCVQRGWIRWPYVAAACAILGVWFLPVDLMLALAQKPIPGFWGGILTAVIVPWPIWMILAALLCLSLAETCRPRLAAAQAEISYDRVAVWEHPRGQPTDIDSAKPPLAESAAAEQMSPSSASN